MPDGKRKSRRRPALPAWLYAVVRSKVMDLVRQKVRHKASSLENVLEVEGELEDTQEGIASSDELFWEDGMLERMLRPRATVGELDTAGANRVNRLVAKFVLPAAPDDKPVVESASLPFFLEEIEWAPAGPVSLLHSVSDDSADPTVQTRPGIGVRGRRAGRAARSPRLAERGLCR